MNTSTSLNHFWDTCVLVKYLENEDHPLKGDLTKMLEEAQQGKRKIWYSTILYAELSPSLLRASSHFRSMQDLISSMEGILHPVSATANITIRAGKLRDHEYKLPDNFRQRTEKPKILATPDAIHLATALYVKEALNIKDLEFHTFDDGKAKNHEVTSEAKTVSLLRFEQYAQHLIDIDDVRAVCDLKRIKPCFAQQNLL